MSNIYIQEPPTNGKVLLQTTVGDIDVELWSKEAPKACRNFVQLCMECYYDSTIFHRLVKGFIVQGGDPTGTGNGGESVWGKPFKDELHSRLRFNRRGIIAMANAGPNDNASQFFITLGEAPELDKKHTIFAKVGGNTIYNAIKLEDVEVDSNERPIHPHKIIKTRVLYNPFDDIVPRAPEKRQSDENKKDKTKKGKGTKNFSLLSFGEEAEEDEVESNVAAKSLKHRGKSSHDLLDDEKLSSVPAVDQPEDSPSNKRPHEEDEAVERTEAEVMEDVENVRKKLKQDVEGHEKKSEEDDNEDPTENRRKKIEELRKEARQIKIELKAIKKADSKKEDSEEEEEVVKEEPAVDPSDLVEMAKAEREKFKAVRKSQKKKGSGREQTTLDMLAKFCTKLDTARSFSVYDDDEEEEGATEEKPTKDKDKHDKEDKEDEKLEENSDDDDDTNFSWLAHKLKCDTKSQKVMDANVHDVDRYEIYDPRNPLTKRRREKSKQIMKEYK